MAKTRQAGHSPLTGTKLEIDSVVSELRILRLRSLEDRQRRDRPPKLPSRKILVGIADGLRAVLFPNRLGLPDLTDESVDYYVGHMLDVTLRDLLVQVRRELRFVSGVDANNADREQAAAIIRAFAGRLPHIRRLLESDIQAAYEGDPAARSIDEVLVCYPGITAITHYRLAHELHCLGAPVDRPHDLGNCPFGNGYRNSSGREDRG